MLSPGGGGSGGAIPQTPGQKCRLNFLSVSGSRLAEAEDQEDKSFLRVWLLLI